MRMVGLLLAGIGGVLVGVLGTALAFNLVPLPFSFGTLAPVARLNGLSTQALGKELLRRGADSAARDFVADSRSGSRSLERNGVSFYSQPEPYGDDLCLVIVYDVPPELIMDWPRNRGRHAVSSRRTFGVWGDPSAKSTADSRRQACANHRAFKDLFQSHIPERAVAVLDNARDAVGTGKADFKISCIDYRQKVEGVPCDGASVIRTIDLGAILGAEPRWEGFDGKGSAHVDRIEMRAPLTREHPGDLTFTVRSERRHTEQSLGDYRVLAIEIEYRVL